MRRAAVGVFGATGYTGRELVRLLRAPPPRRASPSPPGSGRWPPRPRGGARPRRPTPTSSPCPTASPRRYAATPARDAIPRRSSSTSPATCGCPTPRPTARGTATITPRRRCSARRPTASPRSTATASAARASSPTPAATRRRCCCRSCRSCASGLVDADDVVVDAKSGATGAGRTLREDLLFCEVADDFSAYSPGRTHRHVGEIEAVLEERTGRPVALTFCPHLLPVKRGILSALYLRTGGRRRRAAAAPCARSTRARLRAGGGRQAAPALRRGGTNECLISVHAAAPAAGWSSSRPSTTCVKGAAGQAIQNLNLALGWPEDGRPRWPRDGDGGRGERTVTACASTRSAGPRCEDPGLHRPPRRGGAARGDGPVAARPRRRPPRRAHAAGARHRVALRRRAPRDLAARPWRWWRWSCRAS